MVVIIFFQLFLSILAVYLAFIAASASVSMLKAVGMTATEFSEFRRLVRSHMN